VGEVDMRCLERATQEDGGKGMSEIDLTKALQAALRIGMEEAQAQAKEETEKLRAAVQDLAKHVWRGDWDKLKPETRELLGEKE
jgi:hypothetical protein